MKKIDTLFLSGGGINCISILGSLKYLLENNVIEPNFKNMKNVEDSFVLFDKIDGRYLYSETEGYHNKKEISKFYKNVLPNLGWIFVKENKFERADEILEIKPL